MKNILLTLLGLLIIGGGLYLFNGQKSLTNNEMPATTQKPDQGEKEVIVKPTQKKKIVFADIGRAGAAPLYVAKEKGLFGPSIDVDIQKIPNMGDQRVGMQAGSVDIYQGTYDMYLSTDGQQAPGVGFMVGDESDGADGLVVNSAINSIEDLKGKKVALEVGTPAYLLFQYVAAEKGLKLTDFDVQEMPIAEAATAFIAGQVDAAGVWEPYITNALKEKEGSKSFATSKNFPGLFPAVYFAKDELFSNPEYLKDFIAGWESALKYIETNPDESYTIMANAYEMTAIDMRDLKSGIIWHDISSMKKIFDPSNTQGVMANFESVKKIMQSNGMKTAPNSAQESINSTVLSTING